MPWLAVPVPVPESATSSSPCFLFFFFFFHASCITVSSMDQLPMMSPYRSSHEHE